MHVLPDALFHALSQVEHGVDLLFLIDTPQARPVGTLDRGAVLLDNLQDPGNVGSILRSAAAAGIKQVYCSPGTAFVLVAQGAALRHGRAFRARHP